MKNMPYRWTVRVWGQSGGFGYWLQHV